MKQRSANLHPHWTVPESAADRESRWIVCAALLLALATLACRIASMW